MIAITILAVIGAICCGLIGITIVAIMWYNIREWRKKK